MNIERFLSHWGIAENPFMAEEAREDPVYQRIMNADMTHPDFDKIYGSPERPGTAVVFGEKGSGKTAIRLLIEEKLREHNRKHPDRMAWVARYDDLNAMVDSIARRNGAASPNGQSLKDIRLYDHMDAIMSLVTTRLIDFLLGDDLDLEKPRKKRRQLRRMSYQKRLDLAVMAMLYDQLQTGNPMHRWHQTLNKLRVGNIINLRAVFWFFVALLVVSGGAIAASFFYAPWQLYLLLGGGAGAILSVAGMYHASAQSMKGRKLGKLIAQEVRVVEKPARQLKQQLGDLPLRELQPIPLPVPGNEDSRYVLMARLRNILSEIGFVSMIILLDRVDEPALVNGEPGKMRSIVWPMLNNKFLQQEGIGFKMLLPIELSHLLKKEDEDFFQKSRLDKQNMIERLEWSGSTLYDVCNRRLSGCLADDAQPTKLIDLFEDDVTLQDLMDALDQMKQPRDAFKFMYRVVHEHCQNTSDENPRWRIPRAVLDHMRKQESQRVQDLYRGLAPA